MAHYAKVSQGVVTKVIVAEPDFFDTFVDDSPGRWIKTSYNVRGGVYYDPATGQAAENQSVINDEEGRQRKNYAGVGYKYDGTGFYPPQPYNSWTLNSSTYLWEAPVAYPDDGNDYEWNEEAQTWDTVE
jgi:hypothetical protein